jgi:hypothetical protein
MPWQRPRGLVHGRAGADGKLARFGFSLEAKPDELRRRCVVSAAARPAPRAESRALARAWELVIVLSRGVAQCWGIRERARDRARCRALRAARGACAAASRRAVV